MCKSAVESSFPIESHYTEFGILYQINSGTARSDRASPARGNLLQPASSVTLQEARSDRLRVLKLLPFPAPDLCHAASFQP